VRVAGLAVLLVVGVALVVRGVVPRRLDAQEAVLTLAGDRSPSRRSLIAEASAALLEALLGTGRARGWLGPIEPDLAITEQTAEQFIGSLLRRSAVVTVGLVVWATGLIVPVPFTTVLVVALAMVTLVGLWVQHLSRLRARAEQRRRTMTSVVQGLLTITMVGATTATPINEMAERALDHGRGWAYELLRAEFRQGTADNLRIYESLGELAARIDSRALRLYADTIRTGDNEALALATIGQRSKALQEEIASQVITEAEEHAKTLQLPVAAFAITIVLITVGVPIYSGF
jgi:hypothetical protein